MKPSHCREPGTPIATFAPDVAVGADLRGWIANRRETDALDFPPLVWIAAPDVLAHAQMSRDATSVTASGQTVPLRLTPRFALNRSWFNDASAAFFSRREVKLRGRVETGSFVARTIWPEDFRFDRLPDECDLPAGATAHRRCARSSARSRTAARAVLSPCRRFGAGRRSCPT